MLSKEKKPEHTYAKSTNQHHIGFCAIVFGFIVGFISFAFDVIVINLSNVCAQAHIHRQYSHLFLSVLSNVAYYLNQLTFFSPLAAFVVVFFSSFICEICWLLDHFHTSSCWHQFWVSFLFSRSFFFCTYIFWCIVWVCILFRLAKEQNVHFLRSSVANKFQGLQSRSLFNVYFSSVLFLSLFFSLHLFRVYISFIYFFFHLCLYLYLAFLKSFSKNG